MEKDFTGNLVHALHGKFEEGVSFHLLAAVVDGLCARSPSRELQEGLSIHVGLLDKLLPGLWDNEGREDARDSLSHSDADPDVPASLSVLLPKKMTAEEARVTVTLPLANTLFSNGRRSTLLASEWRLATGFSRTHVDMVRSAEKHTQVIDIPSSVTYDQVDMTAPLVPITHPRKILEGLGNIIAKVEVDGEPYPASMELQTNIPRLIEARRALPHSRPVSGAIGVWAMIYPKHMFPPREDIARFYYSIKGRYLGTALGKLAFDMSTDVERLAWESETVLRQAFFKGARLHKICKSIYHHQQDRLEPGRCGTLKKGVLATGHVVENLISDPISSFLQWAGAVNGAPKPVFYPWTLRPATHLSPRRMSWIDS